MTTEAPILLRRQVAGRWVVARARWTRLEPGALEVELLEPYAGLRHGAFLPPAARRLRPFTTAMGAPTPEARARAERLVVEMLEWAEYMAREAERLAAAYRRLQEELRRKRSRALDPERYRAALAELERRPPRGPWADRRAALRRRRLEERHQRWRALVREVEWNLAEFVAAERGSFPPPGLFATLKERFLYPLTPPLPCDGTEVALST